MRETPLVQVSTTWALTCPETVQRPCVEREREMEIVNINVTMHDLLVFQLVLHKLTSRSSDIYQKPFFFSKRIVMFFVSTTTGIGMATFTTCTRIMITITHKSHPHQCRRRFTHVYLSMLCTYIIPVAEKNLLHSSGERTAAHLTLDFRLYGDDAFCSCGWLDLSVVTF